MEHMIGHKTVVSKVLKLESISSIFTKNTTIKVDKITKHFGNLIKLQKLNNVFMNKQLIKEEIKKEVKNFLK